MSEKALSLFPHGENGFWVVGCNRNSLFCLSQRLKSGWGKQSNLHSLMPTWINQNETPSQFCSEHLSSKWSVNMAHKVVLILTAHKKPFGKDISLMSSSTSITFTPVNFRLKTNAANYSSRSSCVHSQAGMMNENELSGTAEFQAWSWVPWY